MDRFDFVALLRYFEILKNGSSLKPVQTAETDSNRSYKKYCFSRLSELPLKGRFFGCRILDGPQQR